jgi:hypothetical protein
MVEVYTRGAEIDLARDQAVPLVSKRWRKGGTQSSQRPNSAAAPRHASTELLSTAPADASTPDLASVLAAAFQRDPDLLRSAIELAMR